MINMTTETPVTPADNVFLCPLPNSESTLQIDRSLIPQNVRLSLLDTAIKENVRNRMNAATVRFNKANEAFAAYDKAMAADPAQTAVALPAGERPTIDIAAIAGKAREDLYAGNLRSTREAGKGRTTVDPLVKMVTDAVVREVFDKGKAEGKADWTFIKAKTQVGKDGVAYLDARIAELVATGADAGALNKMKEDRYLKPARLMLGIADNKAIKDGPSILG
jgi:hypothetical protein